MSKYHCRSTAASHDAVAVEISDAAVATRGVGDDPILEIVLSARIAIGVKTPFPQSNFLSKAILIALKNGISTSSWLIISYQSVAQAYRQETKSKRTSSPGCCDQKIHSKGSGVSGYQEIVNLGQGQANDCCQHFKIQGQTSMALGIHDPHLSCCCFELG